MNETHINLHKNGIKNIARDAFKGLFKTEIIRLSENQIENIEEKTFDARELLSLAEIYLSYNKLTKIEKNLLYGLDKLTKIDLSKNKISEIQRGAFHTLCCLDSIDLSSNLLTQIDYETFKGLKKLTQIYMHDNKFNTDKLKLLTEENVEFISFLTNDLINDKKSVFKSVIFLFFLSRSINFYLRIFL